MRALGKHSESERHDVHRRTEGAGMVHFLGAVSWFHVKPRRRRTVLVLIRPVDGTPMYAGSILACGNGISRPPPGEVPLALRAMSTTWGSRSCSDAMDRSMSST